MFSTGIVPVFLLVAASVMGRRASPSPRYVFRIPVLPGVHEVSHSETLARLPDVDSVRVFRTSDGTALDTELSLPPASPASPSRTPRKP